MKDGNQHWPGQCGTGTKCTNPQLKDSNSRRNSGTPQEALNKSHATLEGRETCLWGPAKDQERHTMGKPEGTWLWTTEADFLLPVAHKEAEKECIFFLKHN